MTAVLGELTLVESVPLVAAWASRVAEDAGIRLLLIKGQPATDLGVRADRPSVDVDVWVDPLRHSEYMGLLEADGWTRPSQSAEGVGWGHATTLVHSSWPAALDVHRGFPGFLAAPEVVFEELWARRTDAVIAGHRVHAPDRIGSAVITLLHHARSAVQAETVRDAETLLATMASWPASHREQLVQLAQQTGSSGPLHDVAGQFLGGEPGDEAVAELREWRVRLQMEGLPCARWALALRYGRRSDWPRLLLAALVPTAADRAAVAGRGRSRTRGARAAAHRWLRGLRALPKAVLTLMRTTQRVA